MKKTKKKQIVKTSILYSIWQKKIYIYKYINLLSNIEYERRSLIYL